MTTKAHRGLKSNYASEAHFREMAIKTLHSIYSCREKRLDVFDFGQTDKEYTCVGYFEGEKMPEEQKEGEPMSQEQIEATRVDALNEALAAMSEGRMPTPEATVLLEQNLSEDIVVQAMTALVDKTSALVMFFGGDKEEVIDAEKTLPGEFLQIGIYKGEELIVQGTLAELEEKAASEDPAKYTLEEILNATDEAIALAAENGIDIKTVKGSGTNGNVLVKDVKKAIKELKAPEKDNADEAEKSDDSSAAE